MAGLTDMTGNFLPLFVGPNLSKTGAQKQEIERRVAAQGWPRRPFLKWCKADPEATAIVSLIDFPSTIKAKDLLRLPPLFVYSTNSVEKVRELVSAGKIRAAIVPREGTDDGTAKGTAAEIVAKRYEILKK